MPAHKFAFGQAVRFSPDPGQATAAPKESFTVVRLLPEAAGGLLQYQVKSGFDGHERVVREDQLADQSA
jgi:hypothetical protein